MSGGSRRFGRDRGYREHATSQVYLANYNALHNILSNVNKLALKYLHEFHANECAYEDIHLLVFVARPSPDTQGRRYRGAKGNYYK